MKFFSKIVVTLAASVFSAAGFAAPINALDNAGFETPNVNGGFAYLNGSTYGFTFGPGSGVAANGSAFNVFGASGNQAGFLQGEGATFSQNFNFLGNQVSIGFLAERRPGYGADSVIVMIDSMSLTFGGNNFLAIPDSSNGFHSYKTDVISLSSGTHLLRFTGIGQVGFDTATFIDNVSINATVPEPTTVALLGLGLLGFAASRRTSAKSKNV